MLTIKDARGIIFLTNEYDDGDRVIKQTQADGSTYQFAYTVDANGKITQTVVTDPRGNIRRVTFNVDGYILTDTRALGTPEEQTTTYEREPGNQPGAQCYGSPRPQDRLHVRCHGKCDERSPAWQIHLRR